MDKPLNRDELLELKEFLTERMVDNMSTKDLEEYVANDLFNYFDKLGEHEFLEEARNYWDGSPYFKSGNKLQLSVDYLSVYPLLPLHYLCPLLFYNKRF